MAGTNDEQPEGEQQAPEVVQEDWAPGTMLVADRVDGLRRLREPFPPHLISLLPKQLSSGKDQDKWQCKPGTRASADGRYCGGYHGRAMHLDYVGHAALTHRLLEADPEWNWEPVVTDEHGAPLRDRDGGMWIRLTVQGVTRLGYGDAQGKTGPNATKEVIGDALRNAAMRFGAALALWHKGDLYGDQHPDETPPASPSGNGGRPPQAPPQRGQQAAGTDAAKRDAWWERLRGATYLGSDDDPDSMRGMYQAMRAESVLGWPIGEGETMTFADFARQQSTRLPERPPGEPERPPAGTESAPASEQTPEARNAATGPAAGRTEGEQPMALPGGWADDPAASTGGAWTR